jgi:hypothetical protein
MVVCHSEFLGSFWAVVGGFLSLSDCLTGEGLVGDFLTWGWPDWIADSYLQLGDCKEQIATFRLQTTIGD